MGIQRRKLVNLEFLNWTLLSLFHSRKHFLQACFTINSLKLQIISHSNTSNWWFFGILLEKNVETLKIWKNRSCSWNNNNNIFKKPYFNLIKKFNENHKIEGEWRSELRRCNKNPKVPFSLPIRCSTWLRNLTSLRGSRLPMGWNKHKALRLISS